MAHEIDAREQVDFGEETSQFDGLFAQRRWRGAGRGQEACRQEDQLSPGFRLDVLRDAPRQLDPLPV